MSRSYVTYLAKYYENNFFQVYFTLRTRVWQDVREGLGKRSNIKAVCEHILQHNRFSYGEKKDGVIYRHKQIKPSSSESRLVIH